ncbi:DUF4157 domain-containing protein [Phytomonospora sp. NPDC050363]|uniref:eCIS core domain-containing protein n=1 Tax=Phytomonospora sp. NPDC050363 TaxID=3155642 RepID=UPI0033FA1ECE
MPTPPARPLPRTLRGELEEAFGADFTEVRVHESAPLEPGAPAAFTRGEHIHFAPGAYDPSTPAGREMLAHELAHVLQQRFGRVRDGRRRALEAEAIRAGRAFAAGRPVNVPAMPEGPATLATQHYTVGLPAALGVAVVNGAHNAPTNPQDSFISQRKGGAAMSAASFRLLGGAPNLGSANPAAVTLRLSANGNMAIEDASTDQRQPKVFYATQAVVDESNDRLALLNSDFRLLADPPGPARRRITNGAQTLLRVTPTNVTNAGTGITMTAEQSCNSLFDALVGTTAPQGPQPVFAQPLAPVPHPLIEYHIARELLSPPKPPDLDNSTPANLATTMRSIAVRFATQARGAAAGFVADLNNYGLNEYAAPEVGEGFVTCSMLATALGTGVTPGAAPATYQDHFQLAAAGGPQVVQHARSWTSHYGGVVAKDGADVITMENYARNVEDALATTDQRYYFQMYDTNPPAGGARSWHRAWANTPMQPIAGAGAAPATHEPVSPGARGFTNPITFAVSIPDARYDGIAANTHGAAVVNTIKNDHVHVAGAADAHQELVQVLKGLHFANVRLAADAPGDAITVDAWRAVVHAAFLAARFRGNLQALSHTYGKLIHMRKA